MASSNKSKSRNASRPGGSARSGSSRSGASSRSGSSRSGSSPSSASTRSGSSRSGSSRSSRSGGSARASASSAKRSASTRSAASRSRSSAGSGSPASQNGVVGKLKDVGGTVVRAADRAKGPALTVGAAAAGIAGGLALKNRSRKKVLGVPVPRKIAKPSIGKPSLDGIDVKSITKSVGKASVRLGERSKTVSKDLERVGDQAERFGKFLV